MMVLGGGHFGSDYIGQEGGSPMNGVRALIKRDPRKLFHSFRHVKTEQQKAVCEPESISSSALNLDFPVSRTVRSICCLNSPVSGIFVIVNQKDSDTIYVGYR